MNETAKGPLEYVALARVACMIGGVVDGLMLIPMLVPGIGGQLFGIPQFAPGPDYRYAMHVAASLMLGWTLLLFWSARRPHERAFVLLLTALVVCCLMLAGSVAVISRFIPLASMIPVLVAQLALAALCFFAYVRVSGDR